MSNPGSKGYRQAASAALLLLATLVPVTRAQTVPAPTAGMGAVQGIVVDANTREPLVEVINVISVGAGGPGACPATIVSLNPLTSTVGLASEIIAVIPSGGTALNCTSLSSASGRWGFTNLPPGLLIRHLAFKASYAPHADTFTVVASPAGTLTATPIQHD